MAAIIKVASRLICVVLSLACITGTGYGGHPSLTQSEKARNSTKKALPSFNFTTLSGRKFDSAALHGKVTVLNFWFIGCAPCRTEIPDLNKLVTEFKDKNVVFLALAMDEPERLRKFLKEFPFDYQIVPDAGDFILERMSAMVFPTHIVVDQEGYIAGTLVGGGGQRPQELRSLIAKTLGSAR